MSRCLRCGVEYGSMEYSAVIQPPVTFCSFIQRGTVSSTVMPQITRVFPNSTSVEPDSDIIAHKAGELIGEVQNSVVLNVRVLADNDSVDVSAQDGVVPDA